eukprot:5802238-Amphidinium_carterae.1
MSLSLKRGGGSLFSGLPQEEGPVRVGSSAHARRLGPLAQSQVDSASWITCMRGEGTLDVPGH